MSWQVISIIGHSVLLESFILGILAFGVFITFRMLDFPDLTVDGSFPLGAAIVAICTVNGVATSWALLIAMAGGAMAGGLTAFLHIKLKIHSLLASILTMTMLYSVNVRVMGKKPNIQLGNNFETGLAHFQQYFSGIPQDTSILIYFFLIICGIWLVLSYFFHTDLGIALGASGSNPQMVTNSGMNPNILKLLGVSVSNALVALSGGLWVLYQRFADINFGTGMVMAGLAMVLLGRILLPSNRIMFLLLGVYLGSFVYQLLLYLARFYGSRISLPFVNDSLRLEVTDLKLLTALLVIVTIWVSHLQKKKVRK